MFNKLKQFQELKNQAKTLQNMMSQQSVTIEKSGIKVTINGNFEITSLSIVEEKNKENLERAITECINEAMKKVQRLVAEKMQSMGGMPQF